MYPLFLWQLRKNFFGGFAVDYNYTDGSNACEGVILDPYYIKYNNKPSNACLGLIFQYDSRDVPVNAWTSFFTEV
jgi:hypothetical protein